MKKVLLGIRRTGCVEFSTILHWPLSKSLQSCEHSSLYALLPSAWIWTLHFKNSCELLWEWFTPMNFIKSYWHVFLKI
jgi:hypothetical protein